MVKLIVAQAANRAIGKNNDLLWRLPADMQFFKETTMGHIVVMGRKNWESIPAKFRPLPGRINAVISRSGDFKADGCSVFSSLEEAVKHYENEAGKDIFIIGGGQVYDYALKHNLVDEMLVTHVERDFEADTWFPEIDEKKWAKTLVLTKEKDEKNPYNFKVWKYFKR